MFGLVMVVSHEEEIIKRCLDSVYDLIDQYYIQFDDENDPCIPLVSNILRDKKGTTNVVPWVDFGHNKSIMMKEARNRLSTEYIFWLDAKETFIVNRTELENEMSLSPDCNVFMVETQYDTLSYYRWQIVRNDQLYNWKYPIHEQLYTEKYHKRAVLKSVINRVVRGSNSTKSPDKYLKYAKLCEAMLERDTDKDTIDHCTFYAGMSYRDYGDYESAKLWLRKYLKLNTRGDYDYLSMCRLAEMNKDQNMYKAAIEKYPEFKGAYVNLARLYAIKGDYKRAIIELDKLNRVKLERCMFEENVNINNLITEYKRMLTDVTIWRVASSPPTIIVIDNFLDNPYEVRDFALRQEFDVSGNFPGIRTKSFRSESHKAKFQEILRKEITYWPDGYNGSFQLVCGQGKTWWHRDKTDYSTLLFLSPDPPANTGTSIYKHKLSDCEDQMNLDSNNSSAWELVDKVANKFNRLVLFNGRLTHRADGYFGNSDDTARLIQVFFYDVAK